MSASAAGKVMREEVQRPIANFHASVWGDYFLQYAYDSDSHSNSHNSKDNELQNNTHRELKERLRKKLTSQQLTAKNLLEKLKLIDDIQRLGVSYHFENEIGQVIQYMHMNPNNDNVDLYNCALHFRLLRQQGYNVSSVDVFNKFIDNEGEFKTSIENDIIGMLSLHEATHLRLEGENILEKAINFTTKKFETILLHDRPDPHISQQITRALNESSHKGMIRIEARNYFSVYENCKTRDDELLEFAKLDFNILQRMYQRKLAELTRWWKNLDFANKCSFARDRLVEGYFFTLAVYFEPEYAYSRKMATKMIVFSSILDDIYDAYGTWEELVLFTESINRWKRHVDLNQLPEYLRYYIDELHNYFEVLENECIERKIHHGVEYLKQMDNELQNNTHRELKERLRKKLTSQQLTAKNLLEKLKLIDDIQRLGVSYHFENEIGQVIQYMHMNPNNDNVDLYNCALHFRLLRQQGYNVSSVDVFNKFIDNEGEFKTSIENDIIGMLSLHEATHLRLEGENILEKAINFTTKKFETILLHDRPDPHISQQITRALNESSHKGMIRIEARNYFSVYENCKTRDDELLEFAKLDFNILQRMYQRKLAELTRWWKNLDFANKCPFARDRLVEGYFFTLAVYFEPEYAYSRKMATKMIAFSSILDDIYDAYGTWEELVLFTESINRWKRHVDLNQLPEYLRYYIDELHNYFEVLENECIERKIHHGVEYLKQMVKVMANVYLKEASWRHKSYVPATLEEYMSVSLISSTARFLSINFLIGMDHVLATKEVFDWAFEDPLIFKAIARIMRLIDDIVGFKFEQEREHVVSAVECYMNQHEVSEDMAIYELRKQVVDAWKVINLELIRPTKVPRDLLTRVVGIARFMEVLYNEEDGYTHSQFKGKNILSYVLVSQVDV